MFRRTPRQSDDIGSLIARGKYREARKRLRRELREDPRSISLRLRLADVLACEKQTLKALRVLGRLSDELVADGFRAKGAAVLKKMQRLEPELPSVQERWEAVTSSMRLPNPMVRQAA